MLSICWGTGVIGQKQGHLGKAPHLFVISPSLHLCRSQLNLLGS